MNYAQARLRLGMAGVGMLVVLAATAIFSGAMHRLLPHATTWSGKDPAALGLFVLGLAILMLPLDLAGGFLLPRLYGRKPRRLPAFLSRWAVGVALQSTVFFGASLAILAAGRGGGAAAAGAVVTGIILLLLSGQKTLSRVLTPTRGLSPNDDKKLAEAAAQCDQWGLGRPRVLVADHEDSGFTGGIVGLPGRETIVISRRSLADLPSDVLAVVIARRAEAIAAGHRTRGLLIASGWVLVGFCLSLLLPGAGVASVAQLATTICGFACWTFLGLLTLPTVSRLATYALDRELRSRGAPDRLLRQAITGLDDDGERERTQIVETIFHPLPSVGNRLRGGNVGWPGGWHAARMMLYLSWAVAGIMSRAVHCNAGRPELWVLLPAD